MSIEVPKEFILPCAQDCPFGRRCADKYFDDSQPWESSCGKKIVDAITKNVSPYQSEKSLDDEDESKLLFGTADPFMDGYVSDGKVTVQKTIRS